MKSRTEYMSVWLEKNRERKREMDKLYHQKNKEKINTRSKKWREENPERFKEKKLNWYLKNKNTEKYKKRKSLQAKKWRKNNPEKSYKSNKKSYDKRRKTNENVALALRLRNRVRKVLKRQSIYKNSSLQELLGVPIPEFRNYFFSKFKDNMTLEQFMKGNIHIDHIKPLASFNLIKLEEQKKAFHYTNLQPLWAKDNIKKGSKEIILI